MKLINGTNYWYMAITNKKVDSFCVGVGREAPTTREYDITLRNFGLWRIKEESDQRKGSGPINLFI